MYFTTGRDACDMGFLNHGEHMLIVREHLTVGLNVNSYTV